MLVVWWVTFKWIWAFPFVYSTHVRKTLNWKAAFTLPCILFNINTWLEHSSNIFQSEMSSVTMSGCQMSSTLTLKTQRGQCIFVFISIIILKSFHHFRSLVAVDDYEEFVSKVPLPPR